MDNIEHYHLNPVLMTFTVIQGNRIMKKEFLWSFFCKVFSLYS